MVTEWANDQWLLIAINIDEHCPPYIDEHCTPPHSEHYPPYIDEHCPPT